MVKELINIIFTNINKLKNNIKENKEILTSFNRGFYDDYSFWDIVTSEAKDAE